MREIKFRAWSKGKNEMIYINPLDSFHRHMTWDGLVYMDGQLLDFIMLQFTGLKDKNGKEIYEGDIIQFHEFHKIKCIITWINKIAQFCMIPVDTKEYHASGWDLNRPTIQVIGNIYENPELLP